MRHRGLLAQARAPPLLPFRESPLRLSLPLHFLILLFVLARHLGSCSSGEAKFPHRLRQMGGTKPCYPEGATEPSLCFHRTGVGITSAFLRQRLMAMGSGRAARVARQCEAGKAVRGRASMRQSGIGSGEGTEQLGAEPLLSPSPPGFGREGKASSWRALPAPEPGRRSLEGRRRERGPGDWARRREEAPSSSLPPSRGRFGGTSERATAVEQKVTLPRGRGCGPRPWAFRRAPRGRPKPFGGGIGEEASERTTRLRDCCFSAG